MQGKFFDAAAAVIALLYDACGKAWTFTLYFVWLALKPSTMRFSEASSSLLPALCVQRSSSPPPSPPDAPLELEPHPVTSATTDAAATLLHATRLRVFDPKIGRASCRERV